MSTTINTSPVLFRYMLVHVAVRIAIATLLLLVIVVIIDTAELYRRLAEKGTDSLVILLTMMASKAPASLPQLLPFGMLVGCIASYQKMRQSHEIMAARASGLSQFRLALPAGCFALLLSLVMLLVVDPVASATAKRYAALEREYLGTGSRSLTVSTAGIWLRDRTPQSSVIIHGDTIGLDDSSISNAIVYDLDPAGGRITRRYYPQSMSLRSGVWELRGGMRMDAEGRIEPLEFAVIPSELLPGDLSNSNTRPETVPVVQLFRYISVLQRAGLPTLGHASYLYAQLALPLVLIGMVLIVARLTLGFGTRTGWAHLVVMSLGGGLVFYFIRDFLFVLGTSGRLPPLVAGFTPGAIMVSLGIILLMRADEN